MGVPVELSSKALMPVPPMSIANVISLTAPLFGRATAGVVSDRAERVNITTNVADTD
jgi:hypothetical protein